MTTMLDKLYCRALKFFMRYNRVTAKIASVGGNHRYLRELSQEYELLKRQYDRLSVRLPH
jgi:hypothetical protein